MNDDEFTDGRKLDALIAQEVMGIAVFMGTDILGWGTPGFIQRPNPLEYYFSNQEVQENQPVPHFSSNDVQALEVAKRMIELGFEFALINDLRSEPRHYAAEFSKHGWNIGETTYINGKRAPSAALAICLAALDAIREGVE